MLTTAMVAGVPGVAVAQDDAIGRAVDAIGGSDALVALDEFIVEASGTRSALDEGPSPGGDPGLGGAFESTSMIDIQGDRLRIDYSIDATEFGPPRDVSEIVVGDIGYVEGMDAIVAPPGMMPLLSDRVASIRTHQELLNPHLLLDDVLALPSLATAGEGSIEVVHGITPITLSLDPETGLISQASTMESDPLRRDVEVVVTYEDWNETESGVLFPASVSVAYDGITVHEEMRTVTTDSPVDETLFAIPDGIVPVFDPELAGRGDVNHQYLQSFAAGGFPLDGHQPSIMATELAPGTFHLTGGTHHSMAIFQDGGVVIVEAPLSEVRSQAILDWLADQAPGAPLTHIVQSHHHVDHSGGLRYLAGATGATVVAGETAIPFYESEVFGATSEIVPDGIDGSAIEAVGVGSEPFVIEAGANPVSVHPFPNPHADDMVLVEVNGALWVVDVFNPGFGPPPPELIEHVDRLGLEVSQIVGGHGGTVPWADLVAPQEG